MDFKTAEELLELCRENDMTIAEVMRRREADENGIDEDTCIRRMHETLEVMYQSAHAPMEESSPSMGGLIGGEARKLYGLMQSGKNLCGSVMSKASMYSLAVLEINASMGVIVAAPTAGSSGVLPGVLFALQEEKNLRTGTVIEGMFTAGAVGYLLMRNASISGAEAGCQAEIGSASAMAAAAAVAMMGGSPEKCLDAASVALSNMLGLVCDPIAGLVEAPCQTRNATGAVNALTCAEMVLSGIRAVIPFTEMAEAMYKVGRRLPLELRETALGGCAATKTGCALRDRIFCGGCE